MSEGSTPENAHKRYIYGGCIMIFTFVRIFFYNHYTGMNYVLGMKIRIACCSLLYRKVIICYSININFNDSELK